MYANNATDSSVRYGAIYRFRDFASILFLIGVIFVPYTMLYQAAMLLACFAHALLLLFTDTKQVAYAQILWGMGFAVYFFLHQVAGIAIVPGTSWYRLLICCIMFVVINFYCCYLSADENMEKFVLHFTVIVIAFDLWCMFMMLESLGAIRMGTMAINFPVIGYVRYTPNVTGMINGFCLYLQVYLYDRDRKPRRLLVMLILIASVLLTGSRKALMIIVGCVCIYLLLREKKNRAKNMIIVTILATAAYLLITRVPVLYNIIGARMQDILLSVFEGDEFTESSAKTRSVMIQVGLEYIKKKPWTGYGLHNFFYLEGPYKGAYSHNNYIELLVSGGIPSLIAYYWFYLYMMVRTFFLKTELRRRAMSLGMLIMLFLLDYGWVSYLNNLIFLPIALSFAAIAAKNSKALKERNNRHGGNISWPT